MLKRHLTLGVVLLYLLMASLPTWATEPSLSQTSGCQFIVAPTLEYAPVYAVPLSDGSQLIGYIQAGLTYPVLAQNEMYYQIAFDERMGWVDQRSGVVNQGCSEIPMDNTRLADFETVCIITTIREVYTTTDQTYQTPLDLIPANTSLPITQFGASGFYVQLDSARGGWLSDDAGVITGNCDGVPQGGASNVVITNSETNVWSQPSIAIGEIVMTLGMNTQLIIVSAPVQGAIREDTNDVDDWYYYVSLNSTTPPIGWVWVGRLDFVEADALPTGTLTATALENARLWSLPDVRSGVIIAQVEYGTRLIVLSDAVQGAIRYDTDDLGDWYQVRVGALIGWIWASRMQFD